MYGVFTVRSTFFRHQLALGEELRGRHQHDHDGGDDPDVQQRGVERLELLDAVGELRQRRTEDVGLTGAVQQVLVDRADLLARGDGRQHVVQGEEERGLRQDRKARGERVGARLLVQLHHLFGLTLLVVLVALLDRLHLRLEHLHVAGRLDLLHEERDQADPDQHHQGHDGQAPGPPGVIAEERSVDLVELDDDPRDGRGDKAEQTGNRVH